jgi:hypothetical protein
MFFTVKCWDDSLVHKNVQPDNYILSLDPVTSKE